MADNRARDPFDDWFDEPELPDAWTTRVERLARERERPRQPEDWIEETSTRVPVRAPIRRRPRARLLGLAGLGIALLLAILAAAGVFSSGGHPRAAPTTQSTPTQPATTATVTTTASLPPVPAGTVTPGATGRSVEELQRALARVGYRVGTVDGSYGPATKAAVAGFQRAHGLTADGVAGPKTLAALTAALRQGAG